MNLVNRIDYSKDAIVSKQLIKENGGNCTLFAFDKGQQLSAHTSPYEAAVLLLEGEAVIQVADQKHTLGAGDFLSLPAQVPHALEAVEKFKMLLLMFNKSE